MVAGAWLSTHLAQLDRLPTLHRTLAWFVQGKPLYVEPTDEELAARLEAGFRAAGGEDLTHG